MHASSGQSFNVFYDIQKNRYYKVNKLTGKMQLSTKSGKTPSKFDPQITGSNYIARGKGIYFNTINAGIDQTAQEEKNNSKNHFTGKRKKKSVDIETDSPSKEHTKNRQKSFLLNLNDKNDSLMVKATKQTAIADIKIRNSLAKPYRKINSRTKDEKQSPALIHKITSQSRLSLYDSETGNRHQNLMPSIRHSFSNLDNFILPKQKTSNKNPPLFNPISRLNMFAEQTSASQRKKSLLKFQASLIQYCEINENKLQQNNFRLALGNQKTQKLQKFVKKPFLSSVPNQNDFTLNQTNSSVKMNLRDISRNNLQNITKKEVDTSINQLSKQKAMITKLLKKCQQKHFVQSYKIKKPVKNQSHPLLQKFDLQTLEQKQRLKVQCLRQKQRQAFLSLYPNLKPKENLNLIQQQKDRKINLKNLELLNLENSQIKFRKIYRSQNKDNLKDQKQ